MKKIFLAVLLWTVFSPINALSNEAPDIESWEKNAFQEYQIQKKDKKFIDKLGQKTQKSLNHMVKVATFRIERKGNIRGKILLKEWETTYSKVFISADFGVLDYNHPVFGWLDDFYKEIVSILGEQTVNMLHLNDIKEVNHAIPSVFHPKQYEKGHYKEHFVPFGAAIGYWSVFAACSIYNYAGAPATQLICGPISEAGRLALGIIADPLAEFVWDKYH